MSDPSDETGYFSDDPHLRGGLLIGTWWIPTWLIILLASIVVVGISAKPAYRAWRNDGTDGCLAVAQQAAASNKWAIVRDQAHRVLLARPGDIVAYRLWARALATLGDARTYLAAGGLLSSPHASREDRLEALQMMVAQAPQSLALSAFASLPVALRDDAEFRAVLTPLLLQLGENELAETRLREVIQSTTSPTVHLELLRTLCQHPSPDRLGEARSILAKLISSKSDGAALTAMLLLGEVSGGLAPGEALPDLAKWLSLQAGAGASHHLLAMDQAIAARPDAAQAMYDSAIARFLTSDPGVLGAWLIRHQQHETAAQLLAEPAKTRPDAWHARLSALQALHRESDIEAALAAAPAAFDAVEVALAQAKFEWARGKPKAAASALNDAMNHAALDASRNRFIEIARLADDHGARGSAETAWMEAIRMGWGPLPPYSKLLPLFEGLAAKDRSEDMLAMYRELLRFEPTNPDLLNHFHYLALIHGAMLPSEVIHTQSKLIANHPDNVEFNATLMLADILAGQPKDALACLPSLRISKRVTPMMKIALEGSARIVAGDTRTGTDLLEGVNWTEFKGQECSVFRRIQAKQIVVRPQRSPTVPSVVTDPDATPTAHGHREPGEGDRAGNALPARLAPSVPSVPSVPGGS